MKKTIVIMICMLAFVCQSSNAQTQTVPARYALSQDDLIMLSMEEEVIGWGVGQFSKQEGVKTVKTPHGTACTKDGCTVGANWIVAEDKNHKKYYYGSAIAIDSAYDAYYTSGDSVVYFALTGQPGKSDPVVEQKIVKAKKVVAITHDQLAYKNYYATMAYLGNKIRANVPVK